MTMQVVTRSSRRVRPIKRCLRRFSFGMVVFIGYLATLLSIAIWASWQLVVSYAGASA